MEKKQALSKLFYKEQYLSNKVRTTYKKNETYPIFLLSLFMVISLSVWLFLEWKQNDGMDGRSSSAYFGIIFFLLMIFSLPLDFHIMFTPTEITSIYLKIARSCFFCLRWQKSILFNWNDVKKIYPLTKEGGILGFEVETTRNKLFSKKYPCSQEKEVQDQIAETINLIKRCFPEKFWVERWKRV